MIGAFLASQGLLHIGYVYAISILGDLIGDTLFYGLGRSSRLSQRFLKKRYFHSEKWQFSTSLMNRFQRYPRRVLVIAKWTHAAGFMVLVTAGLLSIPFRLFISINFLASLPKAALFVAAGYFVGEAYRHIDFYIWLGSCVVFISLLIGLGFYVYRMIRLDQR
ncbi:MAG: hypothetical protein CENE_00769 [Candidatus Celerinatantimonas neptuna]|nr:MAG: hypothetical protein CENE_00769 [Candidatus Celerinatantimonas neptuna]